MKTGNHLSLNELAVLVDLPARTIRYYIQLGLVTRPEGLGKGAYYTEGHVEQLLTVRKWRDAGLSLERIGSILSRVDPGDIPLALKRPGDLSVWSRIHLADGVELHINPSDANLAPEHVRKLAEKLIELLPEIVKTEAE